MVNVHRLEVGDIVKLLVNYETLGLEVGDTLRVVAVGHSRWDRMDYADAVSDLDYKVEIMYNYRDFELVK